MLIVFDLTTGEVLGHSGTNTSHPLGPDNLGGDYENSGEVRLHDLDDAALVARILASRFHIDPDSHAVVIDEEYDPVEQAAAGAAAERAAFDAKVLAHPAVVALEAELLDVRTRSAAALAARDNVMSILAGEIADLWEELP